VTGGEDFLLKVWSMHTGSLLHTLKGHSSPINDVAIDPTDQIIASAAGWSNGKDCDIRLWNLETGHPVAILSGKSTRPKNLTASAPRLCP